jgi:aspartyl-tRNA(Asn)/glutamyl-tRNA(Gln) amidotransferase subunit A
MLDEEILYLPIRELGERIRTRKISPVELTESYLDRSERFNSKFNAYATLTRDRAMAQARVFEKEIAAGRYRGPLHGIPYAAKDMLAVKGYPTTWGAKPYKDQTFDYDATVIERLDRAGAILIGKAAMIELAGGLGYSNGFASLTGPARNPWNTDYWTCGSSSGSGAIMAAGLAAFALGSDTRGSIICPGGMCGVSTMRPNFGRIPRTGVMAISWSLDKLGPMGRTADCCGLVLSAIAGTDPKDHDSLPPEQAKFAYSAAEPPSKPLRIGRIKNAAGANNSDLQSAMDAALKVMEQNGAQVEDAQVPDGPFEEVCELIILMDAPSAFWDLVQSGRCAELEDPVGQINGYASMEFSSWDYLQCQRIRTILQNRMDPVFDRFDVLTAPSASSAAPKLEQAPERERPPAGRGRANRRPEQKEPDGISSLCSLPAVSVPCGFSADLHLPYGIQFMARTLEDRRALEAANLFQSHTDWHTKHPALG